MRSDGSAEIKIRRERERNQNRDEEVRGELLRGDAFGWRRSSYLCISMSVKIIAHPYSSYVVEVQEQIIKKKSKNTNFLLHPPAGEHGEVINDH